MHAFRIAYDGRPYHGFQRQPDVPTVSDAILDALRSLDILDTAAVPASYAAAGRTDAGVCALSQTVAFEGPDWLTARALSAALPSSIHAWAHASVSPSFHATHDAIAREYTYYLPLPPAVSSSVATTRATRVCDRLEGVHDFHNLTPDDTGTTRDLSTTVCCDEPVLVVTFRSDGFPRQFVRRGMTLLSDIITGERAVAWVDRVLDAASLSGPDGIPPAPPYPLVLTDVVYPEVTFHPDTTALAEARSFFTDQRQSMRGQLGAISHVATSLPDGS